MNDSDGVGPEADGARAADASVGSLSEETERLLGAVRDWARDHGGEIAREVGDAAEGWRRSAGSAREHLPGGADCRWCPVCRAAAAVRSLNPEVKAHLLVAATSLAQAAAAALETHVPPEGEDGKGDERVEHIDLDEEWEDQ